MQAFMDKAYFQRAGSFKPNDLCVWDNDNDNYN